MNLEEAKELAIKKWQYIVYNDGLNNGLLSKHPELGEFPSHCSYCELFASLEYSCEGCPIRPTYVSHFELGCCMYHHPFYIWCNSRTKENAQAVLDLIISH